MSHDFLNSDPQQKRTSKLGVACTGVGGIMDYFNVKTKWSVCSVEDFTGLVDSTVPFCLPLTGND